MKSTDIVKIVSSPISVTVSGKHCIKDDPRIAETIGCIQVSSRCMDGACREVENDGVSVLGMPDK